MEIISYEWGAKPEFGISVGPSAKEVLTKYLSD